MTVPDSASLDLTTAMTLEAWVNPTASGNWRDVIYKGPTTSTTWRARRPGGHPRGGWHVQPEPVIGASPLPLNTWSHLAATYDGATMRLYVNGVQAASRAQTGSIATSTDALTIGGDALYGQYFAGLIDEVRIYNVALTRRQIQTDMATPIVPQQLRSDAADGRDHVAAAGAQVGDIVNVTADASDNIGVAGVQFFVDGVASRCGGLERPYGLAWDTRTVSNGAHTLTARARDAAGNMTTSAPVTVNVANTNHFQNEVLATGFTLPTSIEFLPDGRMLVVELAGTIKVLPPPYTQPDPTPFLQLTNVGSAGVQQGIYDIALDPSFRHQPLLLRLLHARHPEPRSPLALHRQRLADRNGRRQRVRPLPGSAGRECRASRRRDQLRQRRQALLHDRRALQRRRCAVADQPAREDPPDQQGRDDSDRQPVLRRSGPERRLDLGARAAQPVPGLLRRPDRQVLHRRRRRQRLLDREGGGRRRRRGRELRLAELRGDLRRAVHRSRSTPIRTTAATPLSPAGSSITAPSSRAPTRGATSSPTTRRTGSSA